MPNIQDLLAEINRLRSACEPPREPLTEHELGAVLLAQAQFEILLAETADIDFQVTVHVHGVRLPSDSQAVAIQHVCSVCGGANVEHAFWVDPNTDDVSDVFGTWNEEDAVFCHDCDANHDIVSPEDFRATLPKKYRQRYTPGVRLTLAAEELQGAGHGVDGSRR